MRVKAKGYWLGEGASGYYNNALILVGQIFKLNKPQDFSNTWMEPVDPWPKGWLKKISSTHRPKPEISPIQHIYSEKFFNLTPKEHQHVFNSGFLLDEHDWNQFALSIYRYFLPSYESGEMDFERMMRSMRVCLLGCSSEYQAKLTAALAWQALGTTPEIRKAKKKDMEGEGKKVRKPDTPFPIRIFCARLIVQFQEKFPRLPLGPTKGDNCTKKTLEFLKPFKKIFAPADPPTEKTLGKWRRETNKILKKESKVGRPSKK